VKSGAYGCRWRCVAGATGTPKSAAMLSALLDRVHLLAAVAVSLYAAKLMLVDN